MHLEARVVDVGAWAVGTPVRSVSRMETFVKLEMHKLREASRTQFALVRPLTGVEPLVSLQVTGAAESLMANLHQNRG